LTSSRKLKTVADIAREIGRPARTVRWHCARLHIPRIGRDYILDESWTKKLLADMGWKLTNGEWIEE
jgi:hypothetical protein